MGTAAVTVPGADVFSSILCLTVGVCFGGGRSAALPLPLDTRVHTHRYTHTDMLRRRQGLEGKVNAEQTVRGLFGKKLYVSR